MTDPALNRPGGAAAWLWLALFSVLLTLISAAAPGSRDPAFGSNGRVTTPLWRDSHDGCGLLVQPDGRIVICGRTALQTSDSANRFGLARYLHDGTPDPSFGTAGLVTTTLSLSYDGYNSSIALQPDGMILLAASGAAASGDTVVARFFSDGKPDYSFGDSGKVSLSQDEPQILVKDDGKILVAGGGLVPVVSQMNADGTLDNAFGRNGTAELSYPSASIWGFRGFARQLDGGIVVTGVASGYGSSTLLLARLKTNGDLDLSFGKAGMVSLSMGNSYDRANAVTVQPDGGILLAGTTSSTSFKHLLLLRYLPDGSPDRTFGDGGKVISTMPGHWEAMDALVQPDGRILICANNGTAQFLIRCLHDGSLDPDFGEQSMAGAGSAGGAGSLALQRDWKILMVSSQGLRRFQNAPAPAAVTLEPAGLGSSQATLQGTVNPLASRGGGEAAVSFVLSAYGEPERILEASPSVVSGDAPVFVSATADGLTADRLYHCRVRAVSSTGATLGNTVPFFASMAPDAAQNGPAYVVTTTDDHDDGAATLFDCTLREAINAANTAGVPARISFKAGVQGTITLRTGFGTLPEVKCPLSITGPGARLLSISGNGNNRVLHITHAGPHALSGLTIRDGQFSAAYGAPAQGGGIWNTGHLSISGCTIANNKALGSSSNADGGGIYNTGTLHLKGCTFSDNSVTGGGGGSRGAPGGSGQGGAIFNFGFLHAEGCTFAGNTGRGGTGGEYSANPVNGGGRGGPGGDGIGVICNWGRLSVLSCTFAGNTARAGRPGSGALGAGTPGTAVGVILTTASQPVSIHNTVIMGGTGHPALKGLFESKGFNYINNPGEAGGLGLSTDRIGRTAELSSLLGVLRNNGGPTDTMLPVPEGSLVDAGTGAGLPTDQRGADRPFDDPSAVNGEDGADMGAVELQDGDWKPVPPLALSAGIIRIHLQGEPGGVYQLFTGDSPGGFSATGRFATANYRGVLEFTDPGPLPPRRFYRGEKQD